MLVGEPGIGKTTLCEQLCRFASATGGQSLVGHCYEEGSFRGPYQPFVEMFGSYLQRRDTDALLADWAPAPPTLPAWFQACASGSTSPRGRLAIPRRTAGGCCRRSRTFCTVPRQSNRCWWCSKTCTMPTAARSTCYFTCRAI